MSFRTTSVAVVVALALLGCGGDDDVSTSDASSTTQSTTTEPATTEPTQESTSPSAAPASPIRLDVPAIAAASVDATADDAWFVERWRLDLDGGVAHVGVGVSPEPASVIDPNASIARNQALAAAHGVAADVDDGLGEADVLVAETVTIEPGYPAEHVRVRFAGPEPVVVDLVGLELDGDVHYAVAVVPDPVSDEQPFAIVAAATIPQPPQ